MVAIESDERVVEMLLVDFGAAEESVIGQDIVGEEIDETSQERVGVGIATLFRADESLAHKDLVEERVRKLSSGDLLESVVSGVELIAEEEEVGVGEEL